MDLLTQSIGIPSGLAGWKLVQKDQPSDFKAFTSDPVLQREISYFRANAPKMATAKDLLADPRLQEFALTAYGLTSQIGMTALMRKVLESDPNDSSSVAASMSDARYKQIANAFGYGAASTAAVPATPSEADVALDALSSGSKFTSFSGTFGGVSVKNVDLTSAATRQQIAAKLAAAFQKADGGQQDITVSVVGTKLRFEDAQGRGSAVSFDWDNTGSTASADTVPPAPSAPVDVAVKNLLNGNAFTTFSGTFGGVSLSNVDLSKDTTRQQIADTLTAAFQNADNGRTAITVTAVGNTLRFIDAKARGGAVGFDWENGGSAAQALPPATTTSTPVDVAIENLNLARGNGFATFNGTFSGIAVSNVDLSTTGTLQGIATALTTAFQKADGGAKNITVSVVGSRLRFSDALHRVGPPRFYWDNGDTAAYAGSPTNTTTQPVQVAVNHLGAANRFTSFSGTFGEVTVSNVDLSQATTKQQVADALTAAFRSADKGQSNITVAVAGSDLQFTDALHRATTADFTWNNNAGTAKASAPANKVAGSTAISATGGPNVGNSAFINQVVQKYTEARFEEVVGNTSNTLRTALYAQNHLPNITNWYSVIADRPLANVVQTVLGLPSSFGTLDVDKQNEILTSRMNVADFKDPTKLASLLNRYVAMADDSAAATASSPVLTLFGLSSSSGSATGSGLTTSGSASGMSFSPESMVAILFST